MSPLQGIFAAYAIQLMVAVVFLAMVPFIRAFTRRAELSQAVSPQKRAELYPLEHGFVAELAGAVFAIAFFFERPLQNLGWPVVEYLAQTAPVFFLLLCVYRLVRSIWLLRHLPVSDSVTRSFVRSTMITSAVAGVIVSFLLPGIVQ